MKLRYKAPALIAAAALAFGITACADNSASEGEGKTSTDAVASVKVDEAARAALPADIRDGGELIVGSDLGYPPNEYKDANNKPAGWAVDLVEAVGAKLGLTVRWEVAAFDQIIPQITGGTYHLGSSSFTDNAERQKSVDFVDYYEAGILHAQSSGAGLKADDLCGLKISVQTGTTAHTDVVPAITEECEAAGKPAVDMKVFDAQEDATQALVLGNVDVMTADSPIVLDAIAKTGGKLEQLGDVFDSAPYGLVTDKNTELTEAVRLALQSLFDDGTYKQILSDHGVEDGAIEKITINAGK